MSVDQKMQESVPSQSCGEREEKNQCLTAHPDFVSLQQKSMLAADAHSRLATVRWRHFTSVDHYVRHDWTASLSIKGSVSDGHLLEGGICYTSCHGYWTVFRDDSTACLTLHPSHHVHQMCLRLLGDCHSMPLGASGSAVYAANNYARY